MTDPQAPDVLDPATHRLRIGLVTPAWPGTATPNGIASAVAQLAAGLQTIGHQVTIIAHWIDAPHDHPRVIPLPDLPVSLVDRALFRIMPDRVVRRATIANLTAALHQAIARDRIDVLLIEESFGWAGALAQVLPIPVIVTLHGPTWLHRRTPVRPRRGPDARRETWEADSLHKVAGLISPSRDVLDRTGQEWGLPALPVAIIGNPVAIDLAGPPAADRPEARLLFVGRFDRIKGADVVLDAFSRIAASHPDCRLTFVGPDEGIAQPDGTRLHLDTALAGLPATTRARIDILGQKSRTEVAALRRDHPITLIASRYETFGVALIEAMSAGSAVVSTRVGGCAEILRDGETGLLVPSEAADALADACLRLLEDRALTRRLGAAARADVAARFSPTAIARDVASFVAPLIAAR